MNPFMQLLGRPEAAVGTWIMSTSPIVAEAIGHAGYDWGVIDMEHTPIDVMEAVHMMQAVAGTPLVPVVRVPWNNHVLIKRVLDAGASTLLVPFVQNADEARAAVSASRYPPVGTRGMAAMSRASRFGTAPDFFAQANKTVSVIVQLETAEAIGHIDEIAAVPGIAALFIGPGDLSGSLGHPGQTFHPDVVKIMSHAVARAKALGVPIGTLGQNADAIAQYRAMGFDYYAVGSDLGMLMREAKATLATIRAAPAV